jgi:tetratricopeptide (TPR) repeat protein
MATLESLIEIGNRHLLNIVTFLWFMWCTTLAVGIVICNVSDYVNRRTLAKLRRRYERHRIERNEDSLEFEVDQDYLKTILICRGKELEEDIQRMGLDFESQAVLENFRSRILEKLADFPSTHQEVVDQLKSLYQGMGDLQHVIPADQLFLARKALKRGEAGKAVALLKQAQTLANQQIAESSTPVAVNRGKRLAAQAAYLLGGLAEASFNYFTAMQYYQQAADLQPNNLRYLSAAVELSYAFGELQETDQLLRQIFKIQGKLLGPEHPSLAQTLNNLGVLRHTQGRHAEAEAFYLWALEICEAHLDAHDPEALNLRNNYATFLKEVGRPHEAAAFKARTAAKV